MVSVTCLIELLRRCPKCGFGIQYIQTFFSGFCVRIRYICCGTEQYSARWCSSPSYNRKVEANIIIPSAFSMNGIGFTELSVVFNCLKALCISSGAFYKNIKSWLYPVITQNFSLVRSNAIDRFKGKSISVSGDAQYDSPGFSAKYCMHTTGLQIRVQH